MCEAVLKISMTLSLRKEQYQDMAAAYEAIRHLLQMSCKVAVREKPRCWDVVWCRCGVVWVVVVGCGWLWVVVGGCGWLWVVVVVVVVVVVRT